MKWQRGRAYFYGGMRAFRYKQLRCCWSVSGAKQVVSAYVFDVRGYDKLWSTVASAGDLSAAQVLAANARRFRQEDGFAITKGASAWKSVGPGPRNRSCGPFRCRCWR